MLLFTSCDNKQSPSYDEPLSSQWCLSIKIYEKGLWKHIFVKHLKLWPKKKEHIRGLKGFFLRCYLPLWLLPDALQALVML